MLNQTDKNQKIAIINEHIDNYWREMSCCPSIKIIEGDDIMLFDTSSELPRHELLHTVLRSKLNPSIAEQRVHDIQAEFEERDQAFTWLVNELDEPHDLKSLLFRSGFKSHGKFYCKIASLDEYQELPVVSPAEFRWVDCEAMLHDWLIPQQEVKRFDHASAEMYLKIRRDCLINTDHYHYLVGYLNHKPVMSATLYINNNIAGFFNGCALPEVRRQGIGTASVIARMNKAKQTGCQYAIAEASYMIDSILTELGFETVMTLDELAYNT